MIEVTGLVSRQDVSHWEVYIYVIVEIIIVVRA